MRRTFAGAETGRQGLRFEAGTEAYAPFSALAPRIVTQTVRLAIRPASRAKGARDFEEWSLTHEFMLKQLGSAWRLMVALPWAETKLLIVQAVSLGAESVEDILDHLQRHGSGAKSLLSAGGYLERAVSEGAIERNVLVDGSWVPMPVGDWAKSAEERSRARSVRRHAYLGLEPM